MDILEKVGLRKRPLTDLEMADIVEGNGDPDFAQWLRERHAKKIAEGEASAESNSSAMSGWEAKLVFYGISAAMAAGVILNAEAINSLNNAKNVLEADHKDKSNKPPRPPRRPNIPIGSIALNNT